MHCRKFNAEVNELMQTVGHRVCCMHPPLPRSSHIFRRFNMFNFWSCNKLLN